MNSFRFAVGIVLVFFTVMFIRCEKVTEISELVKNTKKIQVVFYNDTLPDTFVDVTDKKEIKQFANYISNEDSPLYKCGYDGQIVFFMDDESGATPKNSVAMEFNLQDDCAHITYQYAAALQSKKITGDGMKYLKSLQSK
jgi:hypothetical protein